jgi:hypothetical protein
MPRQTTNTVSLRRILQQELLIGQRLVEISQAESEAIIANDITRLSALELEMRQRLEEQEKLESARLIAVRDLAWALGMEGIPTLSLLLPHLPVVERDGLSRLRVQILETQSTLDALTVRNRSLLDCVLEYVRFSLRMLSEATLTPARYGTNLAAISTPTFYVDSKA